MISKYNIEIKLPNKADSIYGKKTYDEILHIINKHNQKMTECLKIEAFEFVITKEIPFTIDYYNSLLSILMFVFAKMLNSNWALSSQTSMNQYVNLFTWLLFQLHPTVPWACTSN